MEAVWSSEMLVFNYHTLHEETTQKTTNSTFILKIPHPSLSFFLFILSLLKNLTRIFLKRTLIYV
jgi:hypothetical protein